MEEDRRGLIWGFVDGSISVSGSMLLAVLINYCQSCNGVWFLGFLKELTDKSAVDDSSRHPIVVPYGARCLWRVENVVSPPKKQLRERKEKRDDRRSASVLVNPSAENWNGAVYHFRMKK